MGFKVIWSPEAVEDLEAIAEYIERDSEFYAKAVVSKILDVARSIKDFPKIGRIVPEIGDENIRERFVYSYRLVYQIQGHQILIVAVIHGKQMFENIIIERLRP
ncbi:MAG TPA: type II toxin-antitoxin system RelE/ParE family toxin [Candidatus Desulfofervidus auxilii]|uniref:Type II toxin-antitoxin system RelE/ParE family toxin n=1 Tax=Desulfofervidus auxilii TaxID=1621989 RepID=A0A7C1ZEE6_DESA2|nr:MAG: type II toxin-antitoxin system RelE/ParE family toxin [Thermodesulfobacteriota bacterium]HEC67670.1 type II toxin-antitoxin system RelE/ParE family toxin [Candidatus Desulfofervidus auxilii]